jgi:molybdenum cofactor biosynthesis protein B
VSVDEHRAQAPTRFGFAVLTVSDSRTDRTDRGGPLLVELVTAPGHRVVWRRIVRDEVQEIRDGVRDAIHPPEVDAVLVTGGTGVARRDSTIEAVSPMLEKELPGFGELFRQLSFAEIGTAAMLSRATAGVVSGRAVFLLPGSPDALELAVTRLVLPELGHLLAQARRRD